MELKIHLLLLQPPGMMCPACPACPIALASKQRFPAKSSGFQQVSSRCPAILEKLDMRSTFAQFNQKLKKSVWSELTNHFFKTHKYYPNNFVWDGRSLKMKVVCIWGFDLRMDIGEVKEAKNAKFCMRGLHELHQWLRSFHPNIQ
jgi:hypothetical protein